FYGTRFDPSTTWTGDPSPLEWPRIFADQNPDSRMQRVFAESLMHANGLSFREIVALESGEGADSIKMALAAQTPVLYNTPGTHVVFGYDTREPDHWWWFWQAGSSEIVLESVRVRRFVFWDDHPAANLIWAVTGLDTNAVPLPQAGSSERRLLQKIDQSVVGDTKNGIMPYPLSIRDLADRLRSSGLLPVLAEPIDLADPIGVRRAIRARERVVEALERLVPRALDTTVSMPLRVAQYHYHNAIGSLQAFARTFYGPDDISDRLEALHLNWGDPPKRRSGAELLREDLKRERDAHEAIVRALAAYDQLEPNADRR
ncbi:MAG: hypothetical protein IIA44_15110, partial [Acidobacteria bacterium]|nr:hypothetical protein [Acidobacteriota bacterium]